MKNWTPVFRQLSMLSQMGLSLIMPLVLCLLLCSWLRGHFHLGVWIYLPGFFFGLGGSAATAMKLYQMIMHEEKESGKKTSRRRGVSFNEHK